VVRAARPLNFRDPRLLIIFWSLVEPREITHFTRLPSIDKHWTMESRAAQMMKMGTVLLAALIGATQPAGAQSWPGTTPLRFESITAPGGLVDFVPRQLSSYLSASIGVPVVVENKPGGGGNVAAAVVARAAPDGHTLLVTATNQAVNPTLSPNPGFDYERDLVPVSMTVAAKLLLVASPSFPAKDITDVIKIAKQKPKSVSIAIPPVGSANHLAAEMLAQYGNIDLVIVPYDVITRAIPDLMADRVDLAVGSLPALLPQVRSGALKALAVISPQRSPLAPEIPTSAEAGLPEMQIDNWICIMGTGGTPAPIIARLDQEIAKALALPEVRDAFAKQGVEIFYMNSERLGEFLHSEAMRFSGLLKHSRIKGASP
jgi:tripartite-type tricarboxylate transporter receptor subunit TctC